MAGITSGSFDQPDETRAPGRTRLEVVRLGSHTAARVTFQPGWRWSQDIKPVVGTEYARRATWGPSRVEGCT